MTKKRKQIAEQADNLVFSAMAEIYGSNVGIGDVRVAESQLLSVLKLKTNCHDLTEAHNLLAQIYSQTGRLEKAKGHFKAALLNSPQDAVKLTINLAELLEKAKKWSDAATIYYMGLALNEDAALHNGLAYCLSKTGNLDAGEYHNRRACALKPGNADYINDLGYALWEEHNLEEAREYFEQALKINPDHELARNNLDQMNSKPGVPALPSSRRDEASGGVVEASVHAEKTKARYTPTQGRYLAFIDSYTRLHGRPPAEAEMEQYFQVAYSSVHQMVLTLEKRGLISRTPWEARSIRVLLPREEIPELK